MILSRCILCVLLSLASIAHGATISGIATNTPTREPVFSAQPDWLKDLLITDPRRSTPVAGSLAPEIFTAPPISVRDPSAPPDINPPEVPLLKSDFTREVNAHLVKAQQHLSTNSLYSASIELWRAARLQPELEEPASALAMCMIIAGDHLHATRILEHLRVGFPGSVDLTFNLASAYYGLGRHDEAIALLDKIADRYTDPGKVHYNIAMNHLASGRTPKALHHLGLSAAIQPRNPFPVLAMARISARAKDRAAMMTHLMEAVPLLQSEEKNYYLLDPAFNPYQNDPDFLALFTAPPTQAEPFRNPLYLAPLAPVPMRNR